MVVRGKMLVGTGREGVAAEMRTREEAVRKGGNKMLGREWRGAFRRSRHEDFDK